MYEFPRILIIFNELYNNSDKILELHIMLIKLKIIIIAILVCSLSSLCQEYSISGLIRDSTTNQPIPYSTVEIMGKGKGTATNSSAFFSFSFTSDNINDTLLFRALGYYDKSIQMQKLQFDSTNTISLKPKIYPLQEVTVSHQSDISQTRVLGNYDKKVYSGWHMQNWMQVAVYIENDDNSSAIIDNVSFYIRKEGKPRTPFRIRIYAVDSISGNPGEELLKENLIVKPKKSGWFTKDVSKYQINVPINGYFVAMEWINAGKKYYYFTKIRENKIRNYGQALGNQCANEDQKNTWVYTLGYGWNKGSYGINALITSRIKYF